MKSKQTFSVSLLILIFFSLLPNAYSQTRDHSEHGHHSKMAQGQTHQMDGMLGNYPMTREASGTSWQPDASPHEGLHLMKEEWTFMAHGSAAVVYDDQGGNRGKRDVYSSNMWMGTARRSLGPGTWGLRGMTSL